MEELLVVVVQFIVEALLQSLIYLPFGLPLRWDRNSGEGRGCGLLLIYLVLGGLIGGLSLLVAPHLLLHSTALRLGNLAVAPLVAGGLSWGLASWRRSWGAPVNPWTHLWAAFCFVLAFGSVRLAYAAH